MRQVPQLLTVVAAAVFGVLVLRRSRVAGTLMLAAAGCGVAAVLAHLFRSRLYANASLTWQFQYYATGLLWAAQSVLISVAAFVGRRPESTVVPPSYGFSPMPPPGVPPQYAEPPVSRPE